MQYPSIHPWLQELWGGDREGGGDHAGDDVAVLLSAARASPRAETTADGEQFVAANPSLGSADAKQPSSRDDVRGVVTRPRHTNFSGEITQATNSLGGVIKVGPWGGSGGQAFYTRGRSVARLWRISLYHSDAIRAFSYDYLHRGAIRTEGPFGGRQHASTGVRETIVLYADEHITAVEGTFGHCRSVPQVVITSLTFHTDKGRTFGPYGDKAAGTPFSIPAENGCIVGFWGRSGWLLDAIGVYITPCSPGYKAASYSMG